MNLGDWTECSYCRGSGIRHDNFGPQDGFDCPFCRGEGGYPADEEDAYQNRRLEAQSAEMAFEEPFGPIYTAGPFLS